MVTGIDHQVDFENRLLGYLYDLMGDECNIVNLRGDNREGI